jgi:predicted MFS family arabinose efflux permease
VLNTVIQSNITKSVTHQEVGGILGIAASLEAITRGIAPSVGGYLLQRLGIWAPGVFSAILMGWAVFLAYWRIVKPARGSQVSPGEVK